MAYICVTKLDAEVVIEGIYEQARGEGLAYLNGLNHAGRHITFGGSCCRCQRLQLLETSSHFNKSEVRSMGLLLYMN